MQDAEGMRAEFTPEESWRAIHETVDRVQSSMYVAGMAAILLLWGIIVSLGYLSQFAITTLAAGFADTYPWFPGPLWGGLAAIGMAGSAILGHRAGRQNISGDAARRAGIRMFLFWLTIIAAAFLMPGAAGLWTEGADPVGIERITVGIISLGYVLFGVMHRPSIVVVGLGIAASFYLPSYFAGEASAAVSGGSILVVALLGAAWVRKSGLP